MKGFRAVTRGAIPAPAALDPPSPGARAQKPNAASSAPLKRARHLALFRLKASAPRSATPEAPRDAAAYACNAPFRRGEERALVWGVLGASSPQLDKVARVPSCRVRHVAAGSWHAESAGARRCRTMAKGSPPHRPCRRGRQCGCWSQTAPPAALCVAQASGELQRLARIASTPGSAAPLEPPAARARMSASTSDVAGTLSFDSARRASSSAAAGLGGGGACSPSRCAMRAAAASTARCVATASGARRSSRA